MKILSQNIEYYEGKKIKKIHNIVYENGITTRREFNLKGNPLNFVSSKGEYYIRTYDKDQNELTFRSSNYSYKIKKREVDIKTFRKFIESRFYALDVEGEPDRLKKIIRAGR
jgi:hypothetical protein